MKKMLFLAFLLFACAGYAMEAMVPLAQLVADSDRIVRGRVVVLMPFQGTNAFGDDLIYTTVILQVNEALKGDRSQASFTIEGGTVGGITLDVCTQPKFKMGEEVLLFLRKGDTGLVPTGGTQSRYSIVKGGFVPEKNVQYREFRKLILDEIERGRVRR